MTLDDYAAWAAGVAMNRHAGGRDHRALPEVGLAFASAIGQVAEALAGWRGGAERQRNQLADALGDVAYRWARLCVLTGLAPSTLLARSRARIEERLGAPPTC